MNAVAKGMPPRQCMNQIMDPVSHVYCYLWDMKDAEWSIFLSWKDLVKVFQKNSFRTAVRKLQAKGLVKGSKDSEEGVKVRLSKVNED
jgi:hypothetical protein